MGLAKRQWEEDQERGWKAPNKYVCAECLDDDYLKTVISDNAEKECCDYCGQKARIPIAAPVSTVLEPISEALFAHFADPTEAGLPRESGEWIGESSITYTRDALESIGLECNEELFKDIEESFINEAWYPCAHGHWLGLHEHEELRYAWDDFCHEIKHRSRYFFSQNRPDSSLGPEKPYSPLSLLGRIGKLMQELDLVKALPVGTPFYRVRLVNEDVRYEKFEDVGPPPDELAGAGRMNPAGISYFYLAFEPETAFAEMVNQPPCHAALAKFGGEKELFILDLTVLPAYPSFFDSENREKHDGLLFLEAFIEAIASPVSKDRREHVDYIPSQVVSEYFAQVFRSGEDRKLDGIVYPSTVRPGGKNIVIFPMRHLGEKWEHVLKLQDVIHHSFMNWENVKKAV